MQLGLGDIENVPSRHRDNLYVDVRLKPRWDKVMISLQEIVELPLLTKITVCKWISSSVRVFWA